MTNFRVGQKVVCVETWTPGSNYSPNIVNGPVEGGVYTVREVGYLHPWYPDLVVVLLLELDNSGGKWTFRGAPYEWEPPFAARRFRPVVDRKTDISLFRAMLTPSKQKVEA